MNRSIKEQTIMGRPRSGRPATAEGSLLFARARLVWMHISKPGQAGASVRELAHEIGCSRSDIVASLHWLRTCGYVQYEDNTARARRVVVPFMEVRR